MDNNGNFSWVKQIPSHLNLLDIDASDNLILAGDFAGAKDFDPGAATFVATSNTSRTDMFILKLNHSGNFIWMKQIKNLGGGSQQEFGLETDPTGNIYFAGNFTASMDFDPGAGVTSLTSVGSDDAFLLKLDPQGNFTWVKQFGTTDSEKIFALEVDKNGNVFSTGSFRNVIDLDPGPASYFLSAGGNLRSCFISKLDQNGNFVYAKNFPMESFGQSITIDSSNNLYIAGGFYKTVDFDPGPGVFNLSNGQLFTVKLDPSGNFAWAAGYQGGFFESIYCGIKVDILKNVYVTGLFFHTIDFDPNPPVYSLTSVGSSDMYIHKLSQCKTSLTIVDTRSCTNYVLNNITYNKSGVYYQTLINSTGCDSIIQLNLTITSIYSQQDITTCNAYLWNGNLLTSTGIYLDTFKLSGGCDSVAQLNLAITKNITNILDTACDSYPWGTRVLTKSGVYTDTFLVAGGCDSIVSLDLIIKQKPKVSLGSDTLICRGTQFILSPGLFSSYAWNDNTSGNELVVTKPGIYWVKVATNDQCTAYDTITIAFSDKCYPFAIPSAFSPNNDGRNDVFRPIINEPVEDYSFEVFNRWGEKVFATTDVAKAWDGRLKSVRQTSGVFVYWIRLKKNGLRNTYKGTFVLVR